MRIEPLMKRHVYTIRPRDSIAHARAILEERRINQLPVVLNGQLVGIVTDRDLRDATVEVEAGAVATGLRAGRLVAADPDKVRVEEVMTANVTTLGPSDSVKEAARLMKRERIGAIPIVEKDRLVGIVTRSDILDAYISLAAELSRSEPGQ